VFRFERACRFLMSRHIGLAEVAAACGYYDQAHLTREWYALAGCSPKAWIARDLPFLQDYEIGGHDNDPDGHESVLQSLVRRPV
jgi:AraC-like DNA-binding protein